MHQISKPAFLIAAFSLLSIKMAKAQDFTLSQFQTHAQIFNPAFVGSSKNDLRIVTGFRNQWYASGFPYQTFLISTELKINKIPKQLKSAAVSLSLADDQIGNGQWRNTWISTGVSASINMDDARKHTLGFGISGSVLMRQFNAKNLLFENQFESSSFEFNPGISSGENAGPLRQGFFQINSGIRYHFSVSEKFQFGIGAAALWLYRPNETLTNLNSSSVSKMNSRLTGVINCNWAIENGLNLVPEIFFSQQGMARELNAGSWLIFTSHLQKNRIWETGFGVFTRFGDAIIPAFRLGNGKFSGQLSYDFTVANSKKADLNKKFIGLGGMGALEFSIVYGIQLRTIRSKKIPIPCQSF